MSESGRYEVLRADELVASLRLADADLQEGLARLARLAALALPAPGALVRLAVPDTAAGGSPPRTAAHGAPEWTQGALAPLACAAVLSSGAGLLLPDAAAHPVLAGAGQAGAVLAAPLLSREGRILGALCALAPAPHAWGARETRLLQDLAHDAVHALELRQAAGDLASLTQELAVRSRELKLANAQLRELSAHDPLTGLANRRTFEDRLRRELALCSRHGRALSLALLDVDHFKAYNDALGHPAGDEALRALARVLTREARGTDLVARLGGEEFGVLMPETDHAGSAAAAERLRAAVAHAPWPARAVTVSVGVATLGPGVREAVELVNHADVALYAAKRQGRDVAVHAAGPALQAPRRRAVREE